MANINLTEKDMLQDLLTTEKHLISSYSTGITESSCQNLRGTLVNNFNNSQGVQYKVFSIMNQKGWYPTKDAQDNDVQQVKTDSSNMMRELK